LVSASSILAFSYSTAATLDSYSTFSIKTLVSSFYLFTSTIFIFNSSFNPATLD